MRGLLICRGLAASTNCLARFLHAICPLSERLVIKQRHIAQNVHTNTYINRTIIVLVLSLFSPLHHQSLHHTQRELFPCKQHTWDCSPKDRVFTCVCLAVPSLAHTTRSHVDSALTVQWFSWAPSGITSPFCTGRTYSHKSVLTQDPQVHTNLVNITLVCVKQEHLLPLRIEVFLT